MVVYVDACRIEVKAVLRAYGVGILGLTLGVAYLPLPGSVARADAESTRASWFGDSRGRAPRPEPSTPPKTLGAQVLEEVPAAPLQASPTDRTDEARLVVRLHGSHGPQVVVYENAVAQITVAKDMIVAPINWYSWNNTDTQVLLDGRGAPDPRTHVPSKCKRLLAELSRHFAAADRVPLARLRELDRPTLTGLEFAIAEAVASGKATIIDKATNCSLEEVVIFRYSGSRGHFLTWSGRMFMSVQGRLLLHVRDSQHDELLHAFTTPRSPPTLTPVPVQLEWSSEP